MQLQNKNAFNSIRRNRFSASDFAYSSRPSGLHISPRVVCLFCRLSFHIRAVAVLAWNFGGTAPRGALCASL